MVCIARGLFIICHGYVLYDPLLYARENFKVGLNGLKTNLTCVNISFG
jgi:hypothetical protein